MNEQRQEQLLLWQSAGLMAMVGICATMVGTISNSYAILLDGIFSFVAVLIKFMMLATSKVIAKQNSRKFQFGYWQFEPLVLIAEGSFTLIMVVYAFSTAVISFLNGGHEMHFGIAIYYALFFTVADFSYYYYVKRVNKTLNSNLVHFDNISWSIDAWLTAGLLISFGIAYGMTFTEYAAYTRYVDPLILMALTIQMTPSALRILIPSVKQIIGVAPSDLHHEVQAVMDHIMAKYNFRDYVSSVQQYGSMSVIDIDILIRRDSPMHVLQMDAIRSEIDEALGGDECEKWLTITFTGKRRWMTPDYDAVDDDE